MPPTPHLRPFPLPLAIGTDICHHRRFLRYLPDRVPSPSAGAAAATTTRTSPSSSSSSSVAVAGQPATQLNDSSDDDAHVVPKRLFKLLDKVFTADEQRIFWRRWGSVRVFRAGDGDDGKRAVDEEYERCKNMVARWIGGRWAAKEAIIKSYSPSNRSLYMRDIEIHVDATTKAPFGIVLDQIEPSPTKISPPNKGNVVSSLETDARQVFAAYKAEEKQKARGLEPQPLQQQQHQQHQQDKQEETRGEADTKQTTTPAPRRRIFDTDGNLDFDATIQALKRPQAHDNKSAASPAAAAAAANTTAPRAAKEEPRPTPTPIAAATTAPPSHQAPQDPSATDELWRHKSGQIVQVSISHDGEYVVATALAPLVSGTVLGAAPEMGS